MIIYNSTFKTIVKKELIRTPEVAICDFCYKSQKCKDGKLPFHKLDIISPKEFYSKNIPKDILICDDCLRNKLLKN